MRRFLLLLSAVCLVFATGSTAAAQNVDVVGGSTSVFLDTSLLASAAGLDLSSVSSDVGPGNLGKGSVSFNINARDEMVLPTTFSYTPGSLAPFTGTIEHTGSVFFNNDTVEVGNFTIGFDENRVMGDNSGFFVESTTGVSAILFDVGNVTTLNAASNALTIEASLLVSPEFASFLGDSGLTGADVGDAAVKAVSVPEPSAAMGLALACGLFFSRRRS